jgi:hypothetical protein
LKIQCLGKFSGTLLSSEHVHCHWHCPLPHPYC